MCVIVLLSSCSKEENPVTPTQTGLAGTWKLNLLVIKSQAGTVALDQASLNDMGAIWTLEIKEDNTFISNVQIAPMSLSDA